MKLILYRALPGSFKRLARSFYSLLPFRWRMGRTYRATLRFLTDAQRWQAGRILAWQWERVQRMLRHAYEHVPGYRQLYQEAGVRLDDIRNLADLKKLPFVTKDLLRDNLDAFTARNIPGWKRVYRTTGGSTGIPFGFWLLQENIERELAFLHDAWQRRGWKPGSLSAVLRGAFIGSEREFFEYDPFLNELRLSTYYLSDRSYLSYRKKLVDARPLSLQAYPSAASMLAELIVANNDAGAIDVDLLLLGSENLYDWQRERIAMAFPSARQFAWYGHAEQVLFAPWCESNDRYHLDPFYGFAEVLSERNEEVEEGKTGELVGTSFWNYATPFIRYRTMDEATKGEAACASCGRAYRLLERIDGRLQEMIVTREGRKISMTQINMHSDVFDNVKQFQFHQREPGAVTFRIVRGPRYSDADTTRIRFELQKKLGDDVTLTISFVERIEVPPSGKFRFLIQELPLNDGRPA